ncbi:MAG: transposase [Bacillota bacterium]|nr:transposase [Bacillota bacterium]
MPRKARQMSKSDIYHIIMRGINRQKIFIEDEDRYRFMQTIKFYKDKSDYQIFAYCLMDNHIHLLLKVGSEPLSQIMRRVCGKFVYWYNLKYDRTGYLFQDRFKSEPVEDDTYFLTVVRYIHQNPLKAGIVKDIERYKWSSYNSYFERDSIIDTEFVLNIFSRNRDIALTEFAKFNKLHNDDHCLDIEKNKRITEKEAKSIVEKTCLKSQVTDIRKADKRLRDEILEELKEAGLSIRQIEKLTGINRGVVLKA